MSEDALWRRVLRAPVFIPALLLSIVATMPIYASVTIGSWVEAAVRRAGVGRPSGTLLAVSGIAFYGVFGLLLPFWVGGQLLGAVGAMGAPVLVLVLLAWLGRW